MLRLRSNWLVLVLVFSIAAWPGYTVLKGLTFSRRKLEPPNPISYVFHSQASVVRSASDASVSAASQQGRLYGYWAPSGLSFAGSAETEYNLHQVTASDSYFWWNSPLQYSAEFKLLLTPVSDSRTRVDVHIRFQGSHWRELRRPRRGLRRTGCAHDDRGVPNSSKEW